jgi:1,4-alpha-glucan branching enzyme
MILTRTPAARHLLVVASLRNQPFADGCVIQTVPARLPVGLWREVFNSDAAIYGGSNRGSFAADI